MEAGNILDTVYYLSIYLRDTYSINILELPFEEKDLSRGDKPIWNLGRDAMRARFKMRLRQCGFPAEKWAFHSFRSGYLCSALMAAGADSNRRTATLEVTAIVAGWQNHGKSQLRYVKKAAEKQIVTSRSLLS